MMQEIILYPKEIITTKNTQISKNFSFKIIIHNSLLTVKKKLKERLIYVLMQIS